MGNSEILEFCDRPRPEIGFNDERRYSPPGSYPPICFDSSGFLISQKDFDALPEYSRSKPTGVYDGKCWKAYDAENDQWWIGCYIEENPPHPDGMLTPYRKALVVGPTCCVCGRSSTRQLDLVKN